MASLSETAFYSRQVIKYGVIGLVVLMVGRVIVTGMVNVYRQINPPEGPPPTQGFGALPPLSFPETTQPEEVTYILETPTGSLPQFEDRALVYLMPVVRPSLLALDRSDQQAEQLGFEREPAKISDTVYRWSSSNPLPKNLTMHIYQGNFEYSVDWIRDPEFIPNSRLQSEQKAIEEVKDLLSQGSLLADDLIEASVETSFLKGGGGDYIEALSLSDAEFVEVDLYRAPLEDMYEAYTPEPDKGVVQAVYSGNPQAQIVEMEYNYFPVDYEKAETYPLKPVAQAWSELQANQGFVASLDEGVNEVVIRRVELGYYDSFVPQSFLQPIYIFQGDDNFVAYVSAVGVLSD